MNIENSWFNYFGLLKGPYKEMNAAWYIEFGSMIVETMIIEIPIPHMFPMLIWSVVVIMR